MLKYVSIKRMNFVWLIIVCCLREEFWWCVWGREKLCGKNIKEIRGMCSRK